MNKLLVVVVKNWFIIYIFITTLKLMCSASQFFVFFMAFKECNTCKSVIKLSNLKYMTVWFEDLHAPLLPDANFEHREFK